MFQIIMQLLDAGSKVDVCEKTRHQSPLFAAVLHDNVEIVRLLISAGQSVDKLVAIVIVVSWLTTHL